MGNADILEAYQSFGRVHVIEDLVVSLLGDYLPSWIYVSAELEEENPMPCVLVQGTASGQIREYGRAIVQTGEVEFWVYVEGMDSKQDGAMLCETVRGCLLKALAEQYGPRRGVSVCGVKITEAAHRESDWAPPVGPVQYADLPQGFDRFAMRARISFHYNATQDPALRS